MRNSKEMEEKRIRGIYRGTLEQRREVWRLLANGLTAKQIDCQVRVAQSTVYKWNREFKDLPPEHLLAVYEEEKDGVPPMLIVGRWKSLNHGEPERIANLDALIREKKTKPDVQVASELTAQAMPNHFEDLRKLARKLRQELEGYDLVEMLLGEKIPTSKCTIEPTDDNWRFSAEERILLEYLQSYLPLWDHVKQWDQDMPQFQELCGQLHRQIGNQADENTGLKVQDSFQEVGVLELDKGTSTTEIEGLRSIGPGLSKDFILTICKDIFEDILSPLGEGIYKDLSYSVEKKGDLGILRFAGQFIAVAPLQQLERCQEVHEEMRRIYRQIEPAKTIRDLFSQLQELRAKLIEELARVVVRGTFLGNANAPPDMDL